jgi:hypothetical protein
MKRPLRTIFLLALVTACCCSAVANPFVVFPKANTLLSPDGRLEVRTSKPHTAPTDFSGTFNTLWLLEVASGRSYKLCDYLGVAAVAWSSNDFLIVTQYVSKRTSRTLVFPMAHLDDPVLLDQPALVGLVPSEFRPALRENDHVFIEGVRVESDQLHLRVWGRGQRDPGGFRWHCEYALTEGKIIACNEDRVSH